MLWPCPEQLTTSPRSRPTRKRKDAPRKALREVYEFILFVRTRLAPGTSSDDGIWFSRRDQGSLFLDREEQAAYSSLITDLLKRHAPEGDLSRRSVETFVQDALFASLDLSDRSQIPIEERIEMELTTLLTRLDAPSEPFRCWVAVEGLDRAGLPARFGNVTFVTFSETQLRKLSKPLSNQSPHWNTHEQHIRKSELWRQTCAEIEVEARDFSAAQELALRRTRQVLDSINAFSDLIPYNYGWIYLPGDAARAKRILPIQRVADGSATTSYTALDPLTTFSWKKLRGEKTLFRYFLRLATLAQHSRSDTCGSLVASAAQWIGRATIDRRREEAFLLYSIALETLVLPGEKTGELGYRLKLRVAHLLGRSPASRERLAKDMTRLYGIRSAIVHAGSYEVTDEDLGLLRTTVKRVLFRLLRATATHTLTYDQLAAWLDRRILRK